MLRIRFQLSYIYVYYKRFFFYFYQKIQFYMVIIRIVIDSVIFIYNF